MKCKCGLELTRCHQCNSEFKKTVLCIPHLKSHFCSFVCLEKYIKLNISGSIYTTDELAGKKGDKHGNE